MHSIDIPDHIRARALVLRGRDSVFPDIDPARTAHVIVDLQNGFMREGAPVEVPVAREIVPNVNRISRALRAAGGLNVFLRYTYIEGEPFVWSAWYGEMLSPERSAELKEVFTPGHPDFDLWPGLDVAPHEPLVNKTRFSGFVPGTSDLHELLQARGIDTLIITGTLTNCCCESTARDACQRNYRVIFVSDGNATHTDAEHNATLINMSTLFADVQDTGAVLAGIAAGSQQASAA